MDTDTQSLDKDMNVKHTHNKICSSKINTECSTTMDVDGKYTCLHCSYKTSNKSNYNKHLRSKKHKQRVGNIVIEEEPVYVEYTCDICNFSTRNKTGMKRHLKTMKHKQRITDSETTTKVKDNVFEIPSQVNEMKEFMKFTMEVVTNLMQTQKEQIQTQKEQMQSHKEQMENDRKQREADRVQTTKMLEQQNNTILEVVKNATTTNNANTINQNNGTVIHNNITLKLLNDNMGDVPSLSNFIATALSDDETISLVRDGMKFHEIFDYKIVKPMKRLNCTSRPLILVSQRSRNHRKNLYVKTDDGWEDDTMEKDILNSNIDNAAYMLHRKFKEEYRKNENNISLDEYMDYVYNIREPLLTESKTESKRNVMRSLTDSLEVAKDDVISNI